MVAIFHDRLNHFLSHYDKQTQTRKEWQKSSHWNPQKYYEMEVGKEEWGWGARQSADS